MNTSTKNISLLQPETLLLFLDCAPFSCLLLFSALLKGESSTADSEVDCRFNHEREKYAQLTPKKSPREKGQKLV